MALFFTCFNVLVLFIVWDRLLRKSLLDNARDQLFDLRDNAWRWFDRKGLDLEKNPHKALRGVLNSHLYNVKQVTLLSYFVDLYFLINDPNRHKKMEEYEKRFQIEDEQVTQYIRKVRTNAATVVLSYLIFQNIFTCFIFIFFALILGIWLIVRFIFLRLFKGAVGGIRQWKKVFTLALIEPLMLIPCFAPQKAEDHSLYVRELAKKHS